MKRASVARYGLWVALPLGVLAAMVMSGWAVGMTWRALGANASPLSEAGIGVALYGVTLGFIMIGERILFSRRITKKDVGLDRSLTWTELGYGVAGFVVMLLVSAVLVTIGRSVFPMVDWGQAQNVGFSNAIFGTDRMFAFMLLVVMAPIAEEIVFRGYLYDRLRKAKMPLWLMTVVISMAFALIHLQVNVGVVVFVLSVIACVLRWRTKSLWPGIILHGMNNLLAFYVTFVLH